MRSRAGRLDITIDDIHSGYKSDKYTVKDIVRQYIDRIKNIDQSGPKINSIILINPDAMSIADSLDQIQKQGKKFNGKGIIRKRLW